MFPVKWLWANMGKKRPYFIAGLIISAISSGILIVNPMLARKLIDDVVVPQNTTLLLPVLGAMLGVQVLRLTLRYVMVVVLEINSQQTVMDMRRRMYDIIQNQDYRFQGRLRTGNLMTRLTNDLDMLRHTLAWISYMIVDSIVIYLSAFIFLALVNLQLTLALAAITPLILIITRYFSRKVRPYYIALRQKLTSLSTVVQENIEGNRVVKALAREDYENKKFSEHNDAFRDTNLATSYVNARYQPVLDLLSQSLTVTTLVVGGIFMIQGKLSAGEMMAFTSLTWALSNPLRNLGMLLSDIQRFMAASSMVIEVFYSQPGIVNRSGAKDAEQKLNGEIAFNHVSFTEGGKEILQDISFHIQPGQTLGILGSTGAGKTSLINMLMRFYEPTSGEILLDGKNIYSYTLSSLRRNMGLAMQDVFLFSDSVQANIAYGRPDLSKEAVAGYAVQADADGFIQNMALGYDTLVGERGVGLSGGQKQRISLARALAVDPAVLILDDTTSAVDMETEKYIQQQLRDMKSSCTKIIIAQRISSFAGADQIIVMDEGRIIERGTHEELLANNGFYSHIYTLQNQDEQEVV